MKLKWLIIAIAPLFVSGCFSAGAGYGEVWGGSKPTTSQKATAATLDVITFPIQAPYLITHSGHYSPVSKKQIEEEKDLMSLLENNPEIALNERWDRVDSQTHGKIEVKPDDSRRRVFIASFSNPNVKYTQDQIETIYQNMPAVSDYVFCSRACSKEFLASHFDEAYKAASWTSYTELLIIVSNPNTPLELVEKVASGELRPAGLIMPANKALNQRRLKMATQPATNTPSVSP